MKFIFLILSTALVSFGMGYIKFFGVSHLSEAIYTPKDKEWIIQIVGSLLTLGPVLIYFLSGPLAASTKKRFLMFFAASASALLFLSGHLSGWRGTPWLYLGITGMTIGVFNASKMACVPLMAEETKKSTFFINGILSVIFIIGMLFGVPLGTYFYDSNPTLGVFIAVGVFALAGFVSLPVSFQKEELHDFKTTLRSLFTQSTDLGLRFFPYLFSSPLMWGTSSAVSLAIIAYAEKMHLGSDVKCSLMSLWAAMGVIAGNAVSPLFLKNRYLVSALFSFLCVLITFSFPILIPALSPSENIESNLMIYNLTGFLLGAFGFFFGLATNLIDSEYLKKVGDLNKEGTGAAFQSAMVSVFTVIVGAFTGFSVYFQWLGSETQFFALGLILLTASLPVIFLYLNSKAAIPVLIFLSRIFLSFLISLRYRITIKGKEHLKNLQHTLILPNHPAEIDPLILQTYLSKFARIRPLVTESFYEMPILNTMLSWVKAIPVPNLETGSSPFKIRRMEKVLETSAKALTEGDNILLYPAGRLKRSGREDLKGASAVYSLLKSNPKTRILLVRTTGLWGSITSVAHNAGITPSPYELIPKMIRILLKNFLFFTPRRKVLIEIFSAGEDFPRTGDKNEINRYLESIYNHKGEEPLSLVSFCFYKPEFPQSLEKKETQNTTPVNLDIQIQEKIFEKLSLASSVPKSSLSLQTRLLEDLGLDSLDLSELLIWLEENFETREIEMKDLISIESLFQALGNQKKNQNAQQKSDTLPGWEEAHRPEPCYRPAKTILEAFLYTCERMQNHVAVADETLGCMKYKDLKFRACLLASSIKTMEGDQIGIMMPASAGAGLLIIATLMAGKTPVMINWTVGSSNFSHVVNLSGIKNVLTSMKFIDKLGNIDLGCLEEKLVFLEELKRYHWGIADFFLAWKQSRKRAEILIEESSIQENQPAVILFTSGSESLPKGVTLTHANVLANISDIMEFINFSKDDVMYGFLPPFHSFGFTVTTILPLVLGLKAAYYPNPTESSRLARGIHLFNATITCGTPSFFSGIFKIANKEQLKSLRLFVSGAEKAPDELFDKVKTITNGAELIEGYGITECSPVLTVNRPKSQRCGVGKPLKSVSICIVDPQTHQKLSPKERGLILASGPNIFHGYLGCDAKNPFIRIDGVNWYNTGDLGYLDNGHLILSGRQKRFVKIGGEMVSLPALEETLFKKWPCDEGVNLAIQSLEIDGEKPVLCLFTVLNITKEEANQVLKEAGFSNVARLTCVKKLETIPLLGTGKTDYLQLKKILETHSTFA